MSRLLSSVGAFVLFCLISAGAAPAAESTLGGRVRHAQELAAIDEPIVCILTIQHPEIIANSSPTSRPRSTRA